MVKLVTKKYKLWEIVTFSGKDIKDERLMYFIKKNFKTYTNLDLKQITSSKKYQDFLKNNETLYDCKKVNIYDKKSGSLLHGNGNKKNITFIKNAKGFMVVLEVVKLVGGTLSPAFFMSNINFEYCLHADVLNEELLGLEAIVWDVEPLGLEEEIYWDRYDVPLPNTSYASYLPPTIPPHNGELFAPSYGDPDPPSDGELNEERKGYTGYKDQLVYTKKQPSYRATPYGKKNPQKGGFDLKCLQNILKKIYPDITDSIILQILSDITDLINIMKRNFLSDVKHDFGIIFELIRLIIESLDPIILNESKILREAVNNTCNAEYKILCFEDGYDFKTQNYPIPPKKKYIEDTTVLKDSIIYIGGLFPNIASEFDPSTCGRCTEPDCNFDDTQKALFTCLFDILISDYLALDTIILKECKLTYNIDTTTDTTYFNLNATLKNNNKFDFNFPKGLFSIANVKILIKMIQENIPSSGDAYLDYIFGIIKNHIQNDDDKNTFYFLFTFLKFSGDQLQVLFAYVYKCYLLSIDRIAASTAISKKLSTFTKFTSTGAGAGDNTIENIVRNSPFFNDITLTPESTKRLLFHTFGTVDWCALISAYVIISTSLEQDICEAIYKIYNLYIPNLREITGVTHITGMITFNLIDNITIDTSGITYLQRIGNGVSSSLVTKTLYSISSFKDYIESVKSLLEDIITNYNISISSKSVLEYRQEQTIEKKCNEHYENILKSLKGILYRHQTLLTKFQKMLEVFERQKNSRSRTPQGDTQAKIDKCANIIGIFTYLLDHFNEYILEPNPQIQDVIRILQTVIDRI